MTTSLRSHSHTSDWRTHLARTGCALALAAISLPGTAASGYTASLLPSRPVDEILADGAVAKVGSASYITFFESQMPLVSLDGRLSAGTVKDPLAQPTLLSSGPYLSSPSLVESYYKAAPNDAFLRRDGQIERFGIAGMNNAVVAFNDKGQVLAQADDGRVRIVGEPGQSATFLDSSYSARSQAFMYDKGVVTPLGTLGGQSSRATAINASGVVLGDATLAGEEHSQAFIYDHGQMKAIGPADSRGIALNDRGDALVVRAFWAKEGPGTFLYTADGRLSQIAPGEGVDAVAIAANGDVVVNLIKSGQNQWSPYLYKNGQLSAIDVRDTTGDGIIDTKARDLNSLGMVTGMQLTGAYNPSGFLYANGQFVNLDTLIDPALGLHFVAGDKVDELGRVVAVTASGDRYLLSPVPEASSLAMMSLGVLALAAQRRRSARRFEIH